MITESIFILSFLVFVVLVWKLVRLTVKWMLIALCLFLLVANVPKLRTSLDSLQKQIFHSWVQ